MDDYGRNGRNGYGNSDYGDSYYGNGYNNGSGNRRSGTRSNGNGNFGEVENVKGEHYVAMPRSWESRNNIDMNQGMGYNNMADMANTPYPPTKMEGARRNVQLSPQMPPENDFNYNKNR